MLSKFQCDILREHVKRRVRLQQNATVEFQVKEEARLVLQMISQNNEQSNYARLHELFPILIRPGNREFTIKTVEDVRVAVNNASTFTHLKIALSFDWSRTCSLGDLGQLGPEFATLAGRVWKINLCGIIPVEFAECVNIVRPRLLHIYPNSKRISPDFITNLNQAKTISISVSDGKKYQPLVEAVLKNTSSEVLIFKTASTRG